MSSSAAELESLLQSMLALKAPGVTGSKISTITNLCIANVQSESILIGKVYTHFKRAPGTHKLGVLYVIDSVTRQWLEHARKAGQQPGPHAADGTFAAGVFHVTELLPSLMTDIINTAPEDQKEKIKKLVDIWERGSTFPAHILASFKEKFTAPTSQAMKSTTPDGTPPKDFIALNEQPAPAAAPAQDTSAILKALADMAKSNTTAPGGSSQASSHNVTNAQNLYPQNVPLSVNQNGSVPQNQAVGVPGAVNPAMPFTGASNNPNLAHTLSNMTSGQSTVQGGSLLPAGMTPEVFQQQLQLLQLLQAQGIPQEQWGTVLSAFMSGAAGGAAMPGVTNAAYAAPNWQQNHGYGGNDQSRDRSSFHDQTPSSGNRRQRSRSRSPSRWGDRRDVTPPRRRDSPVYGDYRGNTTRDSGRGDYGAQGGRRGQGDSYRRRSPDRYRRSPSPRQHNIPPPGPKWIEYDRTLGDGMIKVLSRTLFVGGVTCSDEKLRGIFTEFGVVQTCIVNTDKRHAFVKMITRADSMRAKEGMERFKSSEMQLRTKWGVGFGPRDCSDYQTGISIIPIERLTDADRKWMLTAEYGGTGGKPIESGLVVEEPDIEIGAGVSSKAISRRMVTDKAGHQGPRSERRGLQQDSGPRYRQPEPSNRDNNPVGAPPAVPGFGFQFPMMPNGMPMFPGAFGMTPGGGTAQPPPPGAG